MFSTDTAYLLVSAATALLRLLVESDNNPDRTEACSKLLSFLQTLRMVRDDYDWDLAQLCIDTCGQTIEKLVAMNSSVLHTDLVPSSNITANENSAPPQDLAAIPNGAPLQDIGSARAANDLMTFPMDLDIPWDYLWDDMVEPWLLDPRFNVV
jgi:hypothetical protein